MYTKIFNKSKILDWFSSKYFVLTIIFLVSILIRIPRINNPYGDDAFQILWMAQAILNGALTSGNSWIIHPLSFFGFFPYSHYPPGVPLLVASFLFVGFSLKSTLVIINIFLLAFTLIGLHKITQVLFQESLLKYLYMVFIVLGNVDFYRGTYYTISARVFIMSLSIWFFYYLFLIYTEGKIKNYLWAIVFLCLMIISHRLAFIHFVSVFALITLKIGSLPVIKPKLTKMYGKNWVKYGIYVITLSLMVLGFFYIPITPGSFWVPSFNIDRKLRIVIGLLSSYITRLGVFAFFLPLGVIRFTQLRKQFVTNNYLFFLPYALLLSLFWTKPLYTITLFLPLYYVLIIEGLSLSIEIASKVTKLKKDNSLFIITLISVIVVIIFSFIYTTKTDGLLLLVKLLLGLSLTLCLLTVPFYLSQRLNTFRLTIKVTFFAIIICSTFSTVLFEQRQHDLDMAHYPYTNEFTNNIISDDEIQIIEYIKSEGCSGIIYTASYKLARRIGGYGFLPTIPGFHLGQNIYYGWEDPDHIRQRAFFDLDYFISQFKYKYTKYPYEKYIHDVLWSLNASTEEGMAKLIELEIQYVVGIKGLEYIIPIMDSFRYIPTSFETKYLSVWKIY